MHDLDCVDAVVCFVIDSSHPRIWLQGDNTVKEIRNAYSGKWASLLTQGRYARSVSHHHMVVGHTHEDIGGML